eukprot:TRINITY_DN416_c2_g1_i1.p5 TRINITY_DN416_c2_g1~~TRINITY_DN416_c2_g1_i1.p5  ORF type:complete len:113 (-),score=5.22 TRINITY_DN416_c2_g1_i1:189-527(-)
MGAENATSNKRTGQGEHLLLSLAQHDIIQLQVEPTLPQQLLRPYFQRPTTQRRDILLINQAHTDRGRADDVYGGEGRLCCSTEYCKYQVLADEPDHRNWHANGSRGNTVEYA